MTCRGRRSWVAERSPAPVLIDCVLALRKPALASSQPRLSGSSYLGEARLTGARTRPCPSRRAHRADRWVGGHPSWSCLQVPSQIDASDPCVVCATASRTEWPSPRTMARRPMDETERFLRACRLGAQHPSSSSAASPDRTGVVHSRSRGALPAFDSRLPRPGLLSTQRSGVAGRGGAPVPLSPASQLGPRLGCTAASHTRPRAKIDPALGGGRQPRARAGVIAVSVEASA
jgi:hypothetical protein